MCDDSSSDSSSSNCSYDEEPEGGVTRTYADFDAEEFARVEAQRRAQIDLTRHKDHWRDLVDAKREGICFHLPKPPMSAVKRRDVSRRDFSRAMSKWMRKVHATHLELCVGGKIKARVVLDLGRILERGRGVVVI
jgi:hypothetical protein